MKQNKTQIEQDEFDKLLDDFIARELGEINDNDNEEENGNEEEEQNDELPDDEINDVVLVNKVFASLDSKPPHRDHRPMVLFLDQNSKILHLEIDYYALGNHGPLDVRLIRRSNSLAMFKRISSVEIEHDSNGTLRVDFDITELFPDRTKLKSDTLCIELYDGKQNNSFTYHASVVYAASALDIITISRLIMGNIAPDSNPLSMDTTTPYVQFAADAMQDLAIICVVNERTSLDLNDLRTHYRIHTPKRRVIKRTAMFHKYDDGPASVYATIEADAFKGGWEKGTYHIELVINEEVVAIAPMTIGDNAIEGEVDINNMLSMVRSKMIESDKSSERKGTALKQLNKMAGMQDIKARIKHLGGMARLAAMRRKQGLPAPDLALHAVFTGNPGTGKTTVAKLMGRIYRDLGLLSSGHVVVAERRTLTGRYYDSEARAVEQAIASARGGILFIDEAYMLNVQDDPRDPGHKVLEHLLTALADTNNRDWMLILAGYTKEMDELMNSNPGLSSRISNVFRFEDYSIDELNAIADIYCREHRYTLTTEARSRLRSIISRDYAQRGESFGNGRYVVNLLEQQILPSLAKRVCRLKRPTAEALQQITAEDIPITDKEIERIKHNEFDDEAIDKALKRLDDLTGQHNVKRAIHNFVTYARYLHSRGERYVGEGILRWNFAGNTGMGKSTVAAILADILRAMGLVMHNNITEVRASHLYTASDHHAERILRSAVEKARNGVLLIDSDAAAFNNLLPVQSVDPVKMQLNEIASEMGSSGAIIIAECRSQHHAMADNLARRGIYDYDHTLIFDDLNAEELMEILQKRMERYNATFSEEAKSAMRGYIESLCRAKNPEVANARTMKLLSRTLFERVVLRESAEQGRRKRVKCKASNHTITLADVEPYRWMPTSKPIGYNV